LSGTRANTISSQSEKPVLMRNRFSQIETGDKNSSFLGFLS